ncbi:MAG: aldose 1-epimerase family protein [Clostridia bacterium]|nr:aldose 1-epimerase family protein [Clostridia bacterium]
MSKEIVIENERIRAVISSMGAELLSVQIDGQESMWDGNPDVWSGHAPVLFPICGGLKDDKFVFGGKEYTLEKHGFARGSEFAVERAEKDSATFLLCSNEQTLKSYPFRFELRITYTLEENKIKVEYAVTNKNEGEMYYSIGAHEAYACRGGIESYSIVFEKTENLNASDVNGNLLEYTAYSVAENTSILPLKNEYFAIDALVFLDLKSRKASLVNNETGKSIEVSFDGADYLLLWTKPGAEYMCIEPWCGIPDFVDSDYDITKKPGIIRLDAGKTDIKTHVITFG